jgi:hypothetical protein
MRDELKEIDAFDAYESGIEGDEQQPSNPRVIQGMMVKFTNEATWVTGADEKLPADLELVIVNFARVVLKWKDGVPDPTKTRILAPGEKFPDVKKLNAETPQAEWVNGPNGLHGPWEAQHVVYLLDPKTMDRYTYPTGTTGGAIAVSDLVDRAKWMRKFRGEKVFPVVKLADVFMPTRFGGRQRPHFLIQRWIILGDGANALPPVERPALDGPKGAQVVEPPAAEEVVKDKVPF